MKKYNRSVCALLGALITPVLAGAQAEGAAEESVTPMVAEPSEPSDTAEPIADLPVDAEPVATEQIVNEPVPIPDVVNEPSENPAVAPDVTVVDLTPSEGDDPNTIVPSEGEKAKDTLSVDFPDEDIRNILRNVADLFELNIVIPDALQGRTSVKLRDVSWRQIFKVVLTPVGYTFVEDGNIIKVVTMESLAQEPLGTKVYILNYARAEEIEKSILPLVDSSRGGRVLVDKRINALIISERPSRLDVITPVLEALDKATEQVMIESKFIEVTNRDLKNIGVNWASLQNYQIGATDLDRSRTETSSRGSTNDSAGRSTTESQNGSSSQTVTGTTPSSSSTNSASSSFEQLSDRLSTLSRSNGVDTITTSVFSAADFNLVLSALKTNNDTRLVSNPTVVTLNNAEANISIGEEFPIPSYTYNQERGTFEVSNFEYKTIGIQLKVTPHVNAQGFIRLILEPEVSSQAGTTTFGGASGAEIPIIATRKSKTQVTLKDGYTMGIGGLVEQNTSKAETKVPLLGSIPGVGALFRHKNNSLTARNLLIFITAKTVSPDGAPIGEVFDPRVVRASGIKADQLPGYRDGSDPFGPSPEEEAAMAAAAAKAKK